MTERGRVPVTVYLPRQVRDAIAEEAARTGVTVSAYLSTIIYKREK